MFDSVQHFSQFNLAVFVSGSGSNLQAIIDAVEYAVECKKNENKDYELANVNIALVISDREGAYALERAKKHNIKTAVIGKSETAVLFDTLKSHSIDGIVLAGYLSIMQPEIINAYENRIINIHPSLLPMFGGKGFYGLRVHQAVLASGVKFSGATAHIVDCGVDTGPALVRGVVPVLVDDAAETLQKRVLEIEHVVLVRAVKALVEDGIEALIQKPITLIDDNDKEGVFQFAKGLTTLGNALTVEDKEER